MRQPSQSLFRLIKKMTPSEKRYFKRLGLSNPKEENQYILLFDAINNQSEYDEKALLKQFKDHTFTNNFSEIKKYLYQQLQKALRIYHAPKSVDIVLYNYLSDIAVLYQKELYVDCQALIKKTKKLASKHEKYNILLLLNEWKRNVVRISHNSNTIREYLHEEVPLDKAYITHVQNESDYFNVGLETLLVSREKGSMKEEFLSPNTPSRPPMSFRAKRYLLWKHTQVSALNQDFETVFEASQRDIQLFEDNPHFIDAMPKQYVVALSNMLSSCENYQYAHHFEPYMKKFLHVLNKYPFNPEFKYKEQLFAYIIRTAIANQKGELNGIQMATEGLTEHYTVSKKKGYLDASLALFVYYELLQSAIISSDFKTALENYNNIQHLELKNNYELLQLSNKLFGIILHYHFENWLFLESLVRSTARIIKLKFSHDNIANAFIKTIKKCMAIRISPNTSNQEVINVLEQFEETLKQTPIRLINERYLLLAWVKSMILDQPIGTCIPMILSLEKA